MVLEELDRQHFDFGSMIGLGIGGWVVPEHFRSCSMTVLALGYTAVEVEVAVRAEAAGAVVVRGSDSGGRAM